MKNGLSDKPISEITTYDISNVVMNMLQQTIPMNDDNSDAMKNMVKSILENK